MYNGSEMEIKIKNSKVIVHAGVKSLESVQLWHLSPVTCVP